MATNTFATGYQSAMQDCLDQYEQGGIDALLTWIKENANG